MASIPDKGLFEDYLEAERALAGAALLLEMIEDSQRFSDLASFVEHMKKTVDEEIRKKRNEEKKIGTKKRG